MNKNIVVAEDTLQMDIDCIMILLVSLKFRWQTKMNRSGDGMPEAGPWTQKPKAKKLIRSARSLSFNTEHADYFVATAVERKRTKRQLLSNKNKIKQDINEMKERLNEIEGLINAHINTTFHNISYTPLNFTMFQHEDINVSAIWENLTANYERQVELEKRLDDLESRLEVTELTTAEITEEMARTRSYLDHLKANMSRTVDETTSNNDTIVKVTEDGEEILPPSKDLKAFQNYLKDIGEITRDDFQELGNQKEDFIASCTWQGTICDSR